MKANPKGAAFEEFAEKTLVLQGFNILERNFSSKRGEIDIIAQKGGIIAFVEVKARKRGSMVSGFSAVTSEKQRRIIATALWYLHMHPCDLQPRFDVFSMITENGVVISHDYLEGAFDGEAYYRRQ